MATNYPENLDNGTSLPYPSDTDPLNSPDLAAGQSNQNDAVIAVETLIGTNSSQTTPTASGNVLQATSDSASEWGLLTSSNVDNATGTGSFVFATSPTISGATLSSPTISTPTFSGSLGATSVSTLSASGLITANSGLTVVGTLTIPNGSITTHAIADGAVTPPTTAFMNYQTANGGTIANTNNGAITLQMGWGQMKGAGGVIILQTVTFPTAFTTLLGVSCCALPSTPSSTAASDITGLTGGFAGSVIYEAIPTTFSDSGIVVTLGRTSGDFSTSTYYGYSWIAWGIV